LSRAYHILAFSEDKVIIIYLTSVQHRDIMVSQVRASHILVNSKAEADKLLNRLRAGAKFEHLAKKHSQCPSGRRGGDLGYFGKGQMVKPFEEVAFSIQKGQVSDPVKTQFGYHIIFVTDKK
jgi:peptidyl-prolyl cis-trans isomerase C